MTKYAKTYAGALYDLAIEEKQEDQILSDLHTFCDTLRKMPEYRKLLSSPAIPKEERKNLLKEAWEGKLGKYTINFLCMLCDGNSVSEIFGCEEEFTNRYNLSHGIINAEVTSAVELSPVQKEKLVAALNKKTGKHVVLSEKIDPALMGGLSVTIEGKQYDGSVAYHLGSIAQLLSEN